MADTINTPSPRAGFDISGATKQIDNNEGAISKALSGSNELSTTDLLRLQQQIAAETQMVSVVTNCMKEQSDAAKNVTANFR